MKIAQGEPALVDEQEHGEDRASKAEQLTLQKSGPAKARSPSGGRAGATRSAVASARAAPLTWDCEVQGPRGPDSPGDRIGAAAFGGVSARQEPNCCSRGPG